MKLQGGDQSGAHGGEQKWWGEWVGEFWHTWWGDGGAPKTPVSQFAAKKNEVFAMKNLINTQSIAPPHAPHHDMIYEILKYNMSTLSGIKNYNFWANVHVFMTKYKT